MMLFRLLLTIGLLILDQVTHIVAINVTIETNLGRITGLNTTVKGETVYVFKRIPFAKPPTGSRRFRKPEEFGKWQGEWNATVFGPKCMQASDNPLMTHHYARDHGSEDCLYLNIFIPRDLSGNTRRSILIWIHGGAFAYGASSGFDGSYLALHGDVIVVTTNYRLGAFGFLSTGDSICPGNFGLWDQHFAIKWVNKNIADYGGNVDSITIYGESAGGVSVGLQTISPYNEGLFQRAIIASGNAMFPLSKGSGPDFAIKLGKAAKCEISTMASVHDSERLMACLAAKSSVEVFKAWEEAMLSPDGVLVVQRLTSPLVDEDFIPGIPADLLNNRTSNSFKLFSSLDIMTGSNDADGGYMFHKLPRLQTTFNFDLSEGLSEAVLCKLIAPSFARDYFNNNQKDSEHICSFYTVDKSIRTTTLQSNRVMEVYGDVMYTMPTLMTLTLHADAGSGKKTFHYFFTHKPKHSRVPGRPSWVKGAYHADELAFVFGLDALYPDNVEKTLDELQLSRKIMSYWTNFVKTGSPNGPGLPEWPKYENSQRKYMNLANHITIQEDLLSDRRKFWFQTVPAVMSDRIQTDRGHTTVILLIIILCLSLYLVYR